MYEVRSYLSQIIQITIMHFNKVIKKLCLAINLKHLSNKKDFLINILYVHLNCLTQKHYVIERSICSQMYYTYILQFGICEHLRDVCFSEMHKVILWSVNRSVSYSSLQP